MTRSVPRPSRHRSRPPGTAECDQADTHVVLTRLPADDHPDIAATPPHLYGSDLTVQFDHGLRLLLAGLRAQLPTTEDGPERTDGCDG
jgi:hypothetical protein